MSARRMRTADPSESDTVSNNGNNSKINNSVNSNNSSANLGKEGLQETDLNRDRSGSRRGRRRTASTRALRNSNTSNSSRDSNIEQKTPVVYRRQHMINPGGSQSLANTPIGNHDFLKLYLTTDLSLN